MFDYIFDFLKNATSYLTWFYIYSILFSFLAVFITLWSRFCPMKEKDKTQEDGDSSENLGIQAQFKLARQKLVEEKIKPTLTAEQLLQEKQSEMQTLSAVLELLHQRSDLPAPTMNELQEQLNLYRKCV